MENLPTTSPMQWPAIWTEEWLQIAIDELEKLDLTPGERLRYEMTLSVNAVIVRKAARKIREAEAAGEARGEAIGEARAEARAQAKLKATIGGNLQNGLPVELIAKIHEVSVAFVREVAAQSNAELSDEN